METKTYSINTSRAISETLDNETIIIDLETGCYYSMNAAGSAIWNAIGSGKAIPTQDPVVGNFLKMLQDDGLIAQSESNQNEIADAAQFADPSLQKYTDMQEMLLADPIHDVEAAGWPELKKEE